MKTLNLKITQDDGYEFLANYDTLSELQKKIWKKIVSEAWKHAASFTGQAKIASWFFCSRKHVNRTLAKFRKWGWLTLQSRGRMRTKIMRIPKYLLMLDLNKREYLMRMEVTSKVTPTSSTNLKITSLASSPPKGGLIEVPLYLEGFKAPEEEKLKLAMLPEKAFLDTRDYMKKKISSGFIPDNPVRYFVNTALNIARDMGFKIPWKRYYATVRSRFLG